MLKELAKVYQHRCKWFSGFTDPGCQKGLLQGVHCLEKSGCPDNQMPSYEEALARAREDTKWLRENYYEGKNP